MLQLLIALGLGTAAVFFYSRWQAERQRQERLERTFYQLIKSNDGIVALIQLATVAQVDAAMAKEYFDRQVKVLNAIPEVDDDGDMTYRFPKLNMPKSLTAPKDDWGDDLGSDWD
jgi:hypothetical protein